MPFVRWPRVGSWPKRLDYAYGVRCKSFLIIVDGRSLLNDKRPQGTHAWPVRKRCFDRQPDASSVRFWAYSVEKLNLRRRSKILEGITAGRDVETRGETGSSPLPP